MKLDARKRNTMAARRTLKILTLALTQLLQVKPFEKISVIDICEKALVPRATFYNYFDDKYDLLQYYWSTLREMLVPERKDTEPYRPERIVEIMGNILEYVQSQYEVCRVICEVNRSSYFLDSLHAYVAGLLEEGLKDVPVEEREYSVPVSLEGELLAGAIIRTGVWWLHHRNECELEALEVYLQQIVMDIMTSARRERRCRKGEVET